MFLLLSTGPMCRTEAPVHWYTNTSAAESSPQHMNYWSSSEQLFEEMTEAHFWIKNETRTCEVFWKLSLFRRINEPQTGSHTVLRDGHTHLGLILNMRFDDKKINVE